MSCPDAGTERAILRAGTTGRRRDAPSNLTSAHSSATDHATTAARATRERRRRRQSESVVERVQHADRRSVPKGGPNAAQRGKRGLINHRLLTSLLISGKLSLIPPEKVAESDVKNLT